MDKLKRFSNFLRKKKYPNLGFFTEQVKIVFQLKNFIKIVMELLIH